MTRLSRLAPVLIALAAVGGCTDPVAKAPVADVGDAAGDLQPTQDTSIGDTAPDGAEVSDDGLAAGDTPWDADAEGDSDSADAADIAQDHGPPPPPPFDDLAHLTGAELRAALEARISGHTSLGYKGDGTAREYMYSVLDAHDGRVECLYTGRTIAAEDPNALPVGTDTTLPPIDNTPETDCRWPDGSVVAGGCSFSTEHSWPQSLGADVEPAMSDLHHLFSTSSDANNARSNFPFGVTTCQGDACTWNENGSELGTSAGGLTVFEVRPVSRGDIARAQLYFAVRYGKSIGATAEATLRAWHAEDPPDARERARNDGIFAVQGNRNPFIDRPDFVDAIGDF